MWQEKYISTLIEEYKTILSGTEESSEKFWKLITHVLENI